MQFSQAIQEDKDTSLVHLYDKKSISRFLDSYETFIDAFEQGNVYISKKHASKILDYLDNDDQEAISKLLEDDKAKLYEAKDFKPIFIEHLKKDKEVLQELKERWLKIRKDPKLKNFIEIFGFMNMHEDFINISL